MAQKCGRKSFFSTRYFLGTGISERCCFFLKYNNTLRQHLLKKINFSKWILKIFFDMTGYTKWEQMNFIPFVDLITQFQLISLSVGLRMHQLFSLHWGKTPFSPKMGVNVIRMYVNCSIKAMWIISYRINMKLNNPKSWYIV